MFPFSLIEKKQNMKAFCMQNLNWNFFLLFYNSRKAWNTTQRIKKDLWSPRKKKKKKAICKYNRPTCLVNISLKITSFRVIFHIFEVTRERRVFCYKFTVNTRFIYVFFFFLRCEIVTLFMRCTILIVFWYDM